MENRYSDEGFRWAASVPVQIVWYPCVMRCTVVREGVLTELDNIFCKCILAQICTAPDIAFVLSLDRRIVQGELDALVSDGMLQDQEGEYSLTSGGADSFARHAKSHKAVEEYTVFLNGITGEWSVEPPVQDPSKQAAEKTLTIQPLLAVMEPSGSNLEQLRTSLSVLYGGEILAMRCQGAGSMVYQEEKMLVYQKEGSQNVKLAFLDEQIDDWDIAVGSALTRRYERRELLELLQVEALVQNQKKHLLEDSQFSSAYAARIQDFRYSRNQEIREMLKNSFSQAKHSIFIVSPWIDHNQYVVTKQLLSDMGQALERGVKISIGYGYLPMEKRKKMLEKMESCDEETRRENREWQTEQMARRMQKRFAKLPFEIFYVGTHEKLLVIDDKYCYVGSFNLLSYDGGEQNEYAELCCRFEGGLMLESSEVAMQIKQTVYQSLPA